MYLTSWDNLFRLASKRVMRPNGKMGKKTKVFVCFFLYRFKVASTSRSLATRYLQGIHILWYRFVSIKNWSVPMNIFRWSWEVRAMMGLILSSLPFEVCAFICWAVGGFWHLREVGVLDKVFMNYFGMVLMFLICLV